MSTPEIACPVASDLLGLVITAEWAGMPADAIYWHGQLTDHRRGCLACTATLDGAA